MYLNQLNTNCLYEPTRYSVKSLHQIVKEVFNAKVTHCKYRRFDVDPLQCTML